MVYGVLIFSFFCILALALYALKNLARGWTLKVLFKDFNRKIWMTIGLGCFFFFLYFFSVVLGSHLIRHWQSDFFLLVYQYPVAFVYGGLSLFAFLSLTIYLVRMFIKYVYLTRGKDS